MTPDPKDGEVKPCLICGKTGIIDPKTDRVFCATLNPNNETLHANAGSLLVWNSAWGHKRIAEIEKALSNDIKQMYSNIEMIAELASEIEKQKKVNLAAKAVIDHYGIVHKQGSEFPLTGGQYLLNKLKEALEAAEAPK